MVCGINTIQHEHHHSGIFPRSMLLKAHRQCDSLCYVHICLHISYAHCTVYAHITCDCDVFVYMLEKNLNYEC